MEVEDNEVEVAPVKETTPNMESNARVGNNIQEVVSEKESD